MSEQNCHCFPGAGKEIQPCASSSGFSPGSCVFAAQLTHPMQSMQGEPTPGGAQLCVSAPLWPHLLHHSPKLNLLKDNSRKLQPGVRSPGRGWGKGRKATQGLRPPSGVQRSGSLRALEEQASSILHLMGWGEGRVWELCTSFSTCVTGADVGICTQEPSASERPWEGAWLGASSTRAPLLCPFAGSPMQHFVAAAENKAGTHG